MEVAIIGAGSDLGVHIDGARFAPAGLINDMKETFHGEVLNLVQDNNIIKSRNLSDKRKNEYEVNKFNTILYEKLIEEKNKGYFTITLGGDSSISIASTLADKKANKKDIGLICFAAHTHYNTYETTVTGNIDGMSIASINGYPNKSLTEFHQKDPVDSRKTVIVGVRNIDPWEQDNVKYSNITVIDNNEFRENIKSSLDKAFSVASKNNSDIHICFNMDVIDPTIASGVAIPEINGINEEETYKILDYLLDNIDKISALDIVGLNPMRDNDERKTEQIALNILANIIKKVETVKNVKKFEKRY